MRALKTRGCYFLVEQW